MALLKLLYLVHQNIEDGRWKTQIQGWKQISAQMQILFEERINQH